MKLALITGATSGIGEALTKLLAQKGYSLAITGRNEKKLRELKKEYPQIVEVITCDLAGERKKLHDFIRREKPDLLINNAGFGVYGDVLESRIDDQLAMVEVNVKVPLELTLIAARALLDAKKEGIILNVASTAAFLPTPGMTVYGATKAAVLMYSQGIDFEYRDRGIRVLTSCPGMVETEFSKRAGGKQEYRNKMSVKYAAKRILQQIEKRKVVDIFDWRYRLGIFISRYVPTYILGKITYQSIQCRLKATP